MKIFKWLKFYYQFAKFKRLAGDEKRIFPFAKRYPCLNDWGAESGTASGHYFHQDLLVASRIFENSPKIHVDIGSRIDGFVAHVAAFRKIEIFDVRPLGKTIPNMVFKQVDFMNPDFHMHHYCDSISSLHAIEHFGLGRYGDWGAS